MASKCKICGKPIPHRKPPRDNATKYCETCREEQYKKQQRKARQRYNKKHRTTKITIKKCACCGQEFISTHHIAYCSETCRVNNKKELHIQHMNKYRATHPKSDKQRYFDNLGNSNLREKPQLDAERELRIIKNEIRRLKLWDILRGGVYE